MLSINHECDSKVLGFLDVVLSAQTNLFSLLKDREDSFIVVTINLDKCGQQTTIMRIIVRKFFRIRVLCIRFKSRINKINSFVTHYI